MFDRTHIARSAGRLCLAVSLLALLAGSTAAQTVSNPRIVEFDPSTDHNTQLDGGVAAVSRYDLEVYAQGAPSPFHTVNLGKPSPEGDGKIRYDFWNGVSAWPLPGGLYEARVSAVGPNGTGRSDPSNGFTIDLCSYTLAETTKNVGASTTNTSVGITAPAGCAWTATTSTSWITLTTATGSGNGAVAFTVSSNATANPRTGTITVAGQTITVVQAGVECTYSVTPASQEVSHLAGGGSLSLSAPVGCSWTASSNRSWMTMTNPSGSGTSTVNFSVTANTSTSSRSGTITVGGQSVSVTQSGVPCSYTLSATTQNVTHAAGTNSVNVTTTSSCSWTASTSTSWITVTNTSGTGNGTVNYSFEANPGSTSRTGTITIGGQTLTVTQEATPCTYTLSAASHSFPASGGSASVTVTAPVGCTWTVSSNQSWLTSTTTSGSGNGTVPFSATANAGVQTRGATLTVGGQAVAVSQAPSIVPPARPRNIRVVTP